MNRELSSYAFNKYGSDAYLYNGIHDLETALYNVTTALSKLTNEASGFLSMAEPSVHGYTNMAVLNCRIKRAREVLDAPPVSGGAPL